VSNLIDEGLISLDDVCDKFPAKTKSGKIARATVWRWVTKGVRGRKLETIPGGRKRYTSLQAVTRFIESLSTPAAIAEQRTEMTHRALNKKKNRKRK
jgi:hypothetical protein